MVIVPYTSVGPLVLGVTSAAECLRILGNPELITNNWDGVTQYCYEHIWVRIDPRTHLVSDCSLIPYTEGSVDGISITWDKDFVRRVCARDGEPMLAYGFVVLKRLGIAISGIHDEDLSQLAVGAFLRDQLVDMLTDAIPFHLSPEV
jgi:hypothetical protein